MAEWDLLEEKLEKLRRNYTMTTPEQRRTTYKAQFKKFESGVLHDASEILKSFCIGSWRFDEKTTEQEIKDLCDRANKVIAEERSRGEMQRLGKIVLRELKIEPFLDAACDRLYPRLWSEAYGPYWASRCSYDENRETYWNSLLEMCWSTNLEMWISDDGYSWTIMLPPTMELIRKEAEDEMRKKQ